MQVTFLIGNGFDLHLNLETSFKHMYQSYIHTPPRDPDVMRLQDLLRKDAPSGYETWGDFEIAMGKHAKNFAGEGAFINAIRSFKDHMVEHLKAQEANFLKRVSTNSQAWLICSIEMDKSVSTFYSGQIPNVVHTIKKKSAGHDFDRYAFIDFNYTTTLDWLLDAWKSRYERQDADIVHIHGRLDNDIVLGVDNPKQLSIPQVTITRRLERAFIKPSFNDMFDSTRVVQAQEMIRLSDVICIYGMALGESDRTWIDQIIQWLIDNEEHHLVYYMHNTKTFNPNRRDEMMDEEDAQKQALLRRICKDELMAEKLFDQVHIPIGYDIFDFHNKLVDIKAEKRQAASGAATGV